MAVTKDEILDAISKMSVMDVVELIADMEKKFNVTAAAPVAVAAAGAGAAAAPVAEAQTEFTVTLTEFGASKVGAELVIKAALVNRHKNRLTFAVRIEDRRTGSSMTVTVPERRPKEPPRLTQG